jgi:hypothetical protein
MLAGSILTYQRRQGVVAPLDLAGATAAAEQLLRPSKSPAKMSALVDACCLFCIYHPPGAAAHTSTHHLNYRPAVLMEVRRVRQPWLLIAASCTDIMLAAGGCIVQELVSGTVSHALRASGLRRQLVCSNIDRQMMG